MSRHQEEDPDLLEIIKWKKSSAVRPGWDEISQKQSSVKYWWARSDNLRICPDTNILQFYWTDTDGSEWWRTLLPEALHKPILWEWHDGVQGGHMGANKTWGRSKGSCFLWASMLADVRQHVRECMVCARNKPGGHGKNAPMVQFPAGAKHEMVGMDLVGSLPLTDAKNKYLLVIVDYWTRWAEAVPIPNKESATVARAFMDNWVFRFGSPLAILTDQGKEFDSRLFKECCQIMGSWKKRTTPFHARCLSAFVQENQKDWDVQIHAVMMAYGTAVQESIGVTPYSMMFGEECPVPLDWVFGTPRQVPQDKIQFVRDLKRQINSAFEIARRSMLTAIKREKRSYDRGARNVPFLIGQFVMCHDKTKKVGCSPALRPKWRGPYIVVSKLNDATVVIQDKAQARTKTVHVDRLKHCFPASMDGWRWAFNMLRKKHPTMQFEFPAGGTDMEGEANADQPDRPADDHDRHSETEGPAPLPVPDNMQGEVESSLDEGSGMSSILSPQADSDTDPEDVGPRVQHRCRRHTRAPPQPTAGSESESDLAVEGNRTSTGQGQRDRVLSETDSVEVQPMHHVTRDGHHLKPPERYGF